MTVPITAEEAVGLSLLRLRQVIRKGRRPWQVGLAPLARAALGSSKGVLVELALLGPPGRAPSPCRRGRGPKVAREGHKSKLTRPKARKIHPINKGKCWPIFPGTRSGPGPRNGAKSARITQKVRSP